ncbi:RICIN domain-containing protein [Hymenobacter sp. HD11105]
MTPPIADGIYRLRIVYSQALLTVLNGSTLNDAAIVTQPGTGQDYQHWQVTAIGGGLYKLLAVHSNKALEVQGGSSDPGAVIQQYNYNDGRGQKWRIESSVAGNYRIVNNYSGLSLDVSGGGQTVTQWPSHNDPNQQWQLEPVTPAPANLVSNPSFEQDGASTSTPQGWFTNDNASADYVENDGMAQHGSYHGTHWSSSNYKVYTYQVITGLTPGFYTLRAWVKRSEGLSHTTMLATNFGGAPYEEYISPTVTGPDPGAWRQVQITGLSVTNGQCEIAFYSDGTGSQPNAGQWMHFDNVEFFKQSSTPSATSSASLMRAATPAAPAGSRLELYPNPAQDQVTVSSSFAQAREVEVTILTAQGKKAASYRHQVPAGSAQFSVPTCALPAGMYLLQVQDGTQRQTQRLVVTH